MNPFEVDPTELVYNTEHLNAFKADYFQAGKYDLERQIPHLSRLGDHYVKRFSLTKDWRDCLKAHALFNSCKAREPQTADGWSSIIFEVQKSYWQECSKQSYQNHCKLSKKLKNELNTARSTIQNDLKEANQHAVSFTPHGDSGPELKTVFIQSVKRCSVACTDKMLVLSNHVISESVKILVDKPPCDFCAVAIGSLARGEATPYSDLEYIFLVEKKSPKHNKYFQMLAMTTYFVIGNFGETKLSYMAIDELDKWFDDKSINGFKIDGLAPGAGNIPTGNGNDGTSSKFTLTPDELVKRYTEVLQNPTDEALRGDLTAMLSYTKAIYSHGKNGSRLLLNFKVKMGAVKPAAKREEMNNRMLQNDLKKFNFLPDSRLHDKGFTVDVKKELYRFPSLLLFDLSIVLGVRCDSAWDTADVLQQDNYISEHLHEKLVFLLACACYIRLSTYLYHNSHDDRLSVAQKMSQTCESLDTAEVTKAYDRWFVPIGLFSNLSQQMIPLKKRLQGIDLNDLVTLEPTESKSNMEMLANAQTAFSCGRFSVALQTLQELFGADILERPSHVIATCMKDTAHGMATLTMVSDILIKCSFYAPALEISKFLMHEHKKSKRTSNIQTEHEEQHLHLQTVKRLALCYDGLTQFQMALDTLNICWVTNGDTELLKGDLLLKLENHDEAEACMLWALQRYCDQASKDQKFSVQVTRVGDDIGPGETSDLTQLAAEDRLKHLPNPTIDIAEAVSSLQHLYYHKGQYSLADSYTAKYQAMLSVLFGRDALVVANATALNKHGLTFLAKHNLVEAEESYLKSLEICKHIYGPDTDHIDTATLLGSLGYCYSSMDHYERARHIFEQSLDMIKRLFGKSARNLRVAEYTREIGWCFNREKLYDQAEDWLERALTIYKDLHGNQGIHVADVNCKLGINASDCHKKNKAVEFFKQVAELCGERKKDLSLSKAHLLADLGYGYQTIGKNGIAAEHLKRSLVIYRIIHGNIDHLNIAHILCKVGENHAARGELVQSNSLYDEALAMYHRIYSSAKDTRRRAIIVHHLGQRYNRIQEFSTAKSCYEEALDNFKKCGERGYASDNIARLFEDLANNYRDMEKYSEAEKHCKNALTLYKNMENTDHLAQTRHSGMASALNTLGLILADQGDHNQSVVHLERALKVYRWLYGEENNHENIAQVLNSLGYSYSKKSELNTAKGSLDHSLNMYYDLFGSDATHEGIAMALYNKGYVLTELNDFEQAEVHLMKALTMFTEIEGSKSSTIARLKNDIGTLYTGWMKWEQAALWYEEAIAIERTFWNQGKESDGLPKAIGNLGKSQQLQGCYEEAELKLQESLDLYTKLHGKAVHDDVAEAYGALGILFAEQGKYDSASPNFDKAVQMYRQMPATDQTSCGLAEVLLQQGSAATEEGDYSKSKTCLKESLQLYKKVHGNAENDDIANVLSALGYNAGMMDDHSTAEKYYTKCISMQRKICRERDGITTQSDLAKTLTSLGQIEENRGNYKKAVELYAESSNLFNALDSHEQVVEVFMSLGDCYLNMSEHKAAEDMYRQAREGMQLLSEEQSKTEAIADLMLRLGRGYNEMGKHNESMSLLSKCLLKYEELHGGESVPTAKIRREIGIILTKAKDHVQAEKHLMHCLETLKASESEDEDFMLELAITHDKIGLNHNATGEYKTADKFFQESLKCFKQHHGQTIIHKNIANALGRIAFNYNCMGAYTEAEGCLEQCLALHQARAGHETADEEIARALRNLGSNYAALEKFSLAEETLQKSISMAKKIFGQNGDHPLLVSAMNDLGTTYSDWGKFRQAVEWLERSVKMHVKLSGRDTPVTAHKLVNLCRAYYLAGDYRAVRMKAQEALAIYEATTPSHQEVDELKAFLNTDEGQTGNRRNCKLS